MPVFGKRVAVVMPAYNAATLHATFNEIPKEWVDDVILVDDRSKDARSRSRAGSRRPRRRARPEQGYGGNQKTCYATALARGADICVMVHPDHQYDASVLPELVRLIAEGLEDAMFGSRMLGGRPLEGGMPKWKYLANIFLTAVENATFYLYLTEYHSGSAPTPATSRREPPPSPTTSCSTRRSSPPASGRGCGCEVPIVTRYFDDASQISFRRSCVYGFSILWVMARYKMHKGAGGRRLFA